MPSLLAATPLRRVGDEGVPSPRPLPQLDAGTILPLGLAGEYGEVIPPTVTIRSTGMYFPTHRPQEVGQELTERAWLQRISVINHALSGARTLRKILNVSRFLVVGLFFLLIWSSNTWEAFLFGFLVLSSPLVLYQFLQNNITAVAAQYSDPSDLSRVARPPPPPYWTLHPAGNEVMLEIRWNFLV